MNDRLNKHYKDFSFKTIQSISVCPDCPSLGTALDKLVSEVIKPSAFEREITLLNKSQDHIYG